MTANHTTHLLSLAVACVLESYLVVLAGFLLAVLSRTIGFALFTDVNTILILGALLLMGAYTMWMLYLISKGFEPVILTEFLLYLYGPLYFISITVQNAFSWVSAVDMLLYYSVPLGVGLFRIAMLLVLRMEARLSVEMDSDGVTFTTKKGIEKILWSQIETILFSGVLVLRSRKPSWGAFSFWRPFRQQRDFGLYAYLFFCETKREMVRRLGRTGAGASPNKYE